MRAPRPRKTRQRCIAGTGLVALDVVSEAGEVKPLLFAGGTCGNVHAILSYLGWKATPIARLDDSVPGQLVSADLARWGVDTSLLSLPPLAKTPVIFQRVRKDRDGVPFHTFSFHCPGCGRRFPGFQPVTASALLSGSANGAARGADVFFVDRVSKSALLLAEIASDGGGIVVFEPASCDGSKTFNRMVELAHVVKYSHERLDELAVPRGSSKPFVEIQTLGRGGLRFRTRLPEMDRRWHHLQAEPIVQLRDAGGSGDWLTAGFLYALTSGDGDRLEGVTREDLTKALCVGQALAAWNCQFLGARGGMYSARVSEVSEVVRKTLAHEKSIGRIPEPPAEESAQASQICANCSMGRLDAKQAVKRAFSRPTTFVN
jgi:sugar/nucleoside kinase (ribokinase family)